MRAKSKLLEVPLHTNSTSRFPTVDVGAGAEVYMKETEAILEEDDDERYS